MIWIAINKVCCMGLEDTSLSFDWARPGCSLGGDFFSCVNLVQMQLYMRGIPAEWNYCEYRVKSL